MASLWIRVMRGKDTQQSALFSYLSPEERVPAHHPLRAIRVMVDVALRALSPVFQRKDRPEPPPTDDPGNPTVNFQGEQRSNETHESRTDPDARLACKSSGQEAKLAYCGNILIENRNGLVVDTELLSPAGTAEREAALRMAQRIDGTQRVTMAGDKGSDTKDFVTAMRGLNVTPHVAQNEKRPGGSAIDARTTRHAG
jgi:hypothetical protein